MQRFIITTFLFLVASFSANAALRNDQIAPKVHIGAFSENTPNFTSDEVLHIVETELGYIAIFSENAYRPLGRFISRDPLGYVDGMSMYAGYFAQGFNLDPSGTANRACACSIKKCCLENIGCLIQNVWEYTKRLSELEKFNDPKFYENQANPYTGPNNPHTFPSNPHKFHEYKGHRQQLKQMWKTIQTCEEVVLEQLLAGECGGSDSNAIPSIESIQHSSWPAYQPWYPRNSAARMGTDTNAVLDDEGLSRGTIAVGTITVVGLVLILIPEPTTSAAGAGMLLAL